MKIEPVQVAAVPVAVRFNQAHRTPVEEFLAAARRLHEAVALGNDELGLGKKSGCLKALDENRTEELKAAWGSVLELVGDALKIAVEPDGNTLTEKEANRVVRRFRYYAKKYPAQQCDYAVRLKRTVMSRTGLSRLLVELAEQGIAPSRVRYFLSMNGSPIICL